MFYWQVDDHTRVELLQQRHRDELFALIEESRAYLREWLLWVDKRQSPGDLESVISLWLHNYAEHQGFDAGIRYDGELVGMIALQSIDWKNHVASIGYFVGERHQGKGIVTNCVRKLITHVFDDLQLNKIVIQCAVGNTKSRAIPERLGFSLEGISRDGQWLYDHYVDLATYSMLRREWNPVAE